MNTILRNKLLCIALLAVCIVFAHGQFTYAAAEPEYTDFSELNGKTIAMLTGAPYKDMISSYIPHVKKFEYFNNVADMLMALEDNKNDAYMTSDAVALLASNKDDRIALFPEPLMETDYGFAFKKGNGKHCM